MLPGDSAFEKNACFTGEVVIWDDFHHRAGVQGPANHVLQPAERAPWEQSIEQTHNGGIQGAPVMEMSLGVSRWKPKISFHSTAWVLSLLPLFLDNKGDHYLPKKVCPETKVNFLTRFLLAPPLSKLFHIWFLLQCLLCEGVVYFWHQVGTFKNIYLMF